MSRFYITTSIMYANANPHIGFALELVQADAIARYRRMLGDEVYFLTGADEHGTKVMRSAQQAGVPTQQFVDGIAGQMKELCEKLEISNTDFIRTSDQKRHWPAVIKLWQALEKAGDIYKKSYEGLYCVGHEAFLKPSELVGGLCPDHKTKPEPLKEENWFFRFSKYRDQVRELIITDGLRIVPERRKQEILNLLEDAEDVSFSRPSNQLPWGIPVPGDDSQTMYVWADALTNYLSGLGYGTDEAHMAFWPAQIHLVGKDIVRFHALLWPAMLMAAGLATPKQLYVHGFITVNGQKMSKTIGNVINPVELLSKWGPEVVRYYFLRNLQSTDDSDLTLQNIASSYNSDLANGLGNIVQRVAALISKSDQKIVYRSDSGSTGGPLHEVFDDTAYHGAFNEFRLHDAIGHIWRGISLTNAYLNDRAPWKLEGTIRCQVLQTTVSALMHLAGLLAPFMPSTTEQMLGTLGVTGTLSEAGDHILKPTLGHGLFPRIEK